MKAHLRSSTSRSHYRARERGPMWSYAPPVLAFVVVNLFLWVVAASEGYPFWDPSTWVRWDSFHYLDIAEDGYSYFRCSRIELLDVTTWLESTGAFLGFDVELDDVCGDSGWFPGYPALIRIVAVTGLSLPAAGVLIAFVFQFATLYFLWTAFLRDRESIPALVALMAATFFFGHVYFRAVFPMSVAAFSILVHLDMLRRDRSVWAGIAGGMTAFVYPTGFLLAPVGAIWFLWARPRLDLKRRLVGASWVAALTMLGLGAVILIQWIHTDVWGAFYKVQSQFDYGIHLPTGRLTEVLTPVFSDGLSFGEVRFLQTGLVAFVTIALLVGAVLRRRESTEVERWVAIALLVFWIFPLMLGGEASLYRIESLLLPSVLLLPRAHRALQILVPLVLVGLSYPMAALFFRNILV